MNLQQALSDARNSVCEQVQQIVDERFAELERRFQAAVDAAAAASRRETSDKLNNAARRLKQADSRTMWERTLLDGAAPFCGQAILICVRNGALHYDGPDGEWDAPLTAAPAFANAVDSKDTVVTAATPREVSEPVTKLLGSTEGGKLYLFPVVVAEDVDSVLCARPADSGAIDVSALELLAAFAGSSIEPLPAPAPPPTNLVTIAAPPPAAPEPAPEPPPARTAAPKWDDLSPTDQQNHLRAQRYARTAVAELLLHKMPRVSQGRASRNLYGTLRDEIDAARDAFRRHFFEGTPTMVDYFHIEMVRTLAKGDPNALGAAYPGALRRRANDSGRL